MKITYRFVIKDRLDVQVMFPRRKMAGCLTLRHVTTTECPGRKWGDVVRKD